MATNGYIMGFISTKIIQYNVDYIALGELDRGNGRENKREITWEAGRGMIIKLAGE